MTASPDMHLTRGTRVGQYEIIELLGTGGMGEVYRARDSKLGRDVAIKVLNVAAALNPDGVRRLVQEARAASALNHPGIVTIHDTGESDGRLFIVMELIEGSTLRHLLRRGPLALKRGLSIASQFADALAKAHQVGIVHRDLKPENVMVSRDGYVKVVDFGLAKLTEIPASPSTSEPEATLTDSSTRGMLVGTVGYMSPEQASGAPADFRSDQFAFGAILYELTTGARAFRRTTTVETLSMIISGEPERALAVNPALPPPLVWTIERCLAKDPDDRYASTRDLAREIQTIRDRAGDLSAADGRAPASRRRTLALVVVALVAALGIGSYVVRRWTPAAGATSPPPPTFRQLTFASGHVANARFAPDGQSILYAASWNGSPVRVFETRMTGPESRPIGPPAASLASISSTGEIALILDCRLDWGNCVGTLARMPTSGGAPREILENVVSADWAPDGTALAAIQMAEGEYQLHFPAGKSLYTSERKLAYVRVSPRGDRLAFVEYDVLSDERGVLKVIDLQGNTTMVSGPWKHVREMVWLPAGDAMLLSASKTERSSSIHVVPLGGEPRAVLHTPGAIFPFDLARDNRLLVAHGSARAHMVWSSGREHRELSWLDWSTVADLSPDGRTILFYEWGQGVGASPTVYLRKSDGSDAVRLGDGTALALSPDGRWALALQDGPPPQLVLFPTGAGESRVLPSQGFSDFYWARWFPGGERLLVVAAAADGAPHSYIQHVGSGKLERIGDRGLLAFLVAPDGRRVLMRDPLAGYVVWPLDGNPPVALDRLDAAYRPVQWSADGQYIFVRGLEETVIRLYRYHVRTGTLDTFMELAPSDPSGVVGVGEGRGELAITPDGKSSVFTYWTFLRNLFVVEGVGQ